MPEYCTCGAKLPEDARFCHKCGRPLRESDIEREAVAAPVPPPPPPPEADAEAPPAETAPRVGVRRKGGDPSIGFGNPITVRSALIASLAGFAGFVVVGQIAQFVGGALGNLLLCIAMAGAGALAVYLYRRRSGLPVTVRGGLQIGWITGILSFAGALMLVTAIAVTLADKDAAAMIAAEFKNRKHEELGRELLNAFGTANGLATVIIGFFFTFGIMPMVGGAIGALLGRRTSRSA